MTASDVPSLPDPPPPAGDPGADSDAREWCVVECLDAFRDETGRPGEQKVPVSDLAHLYTRVEAWAALHEWVHRHPDREFSMRRVSNVGPTLDAITRPDGGGDTTQ